MLFFVAAARFDLVINDFLDDNETWDIEKLNVDDKGSETVAGLVAAFKLEPIPINSAGEQLLMTIPGVGPELARRIVEQRNRYGFFEAPKDLVKVAGIGPRRAEQFTPYLSFD